MHRCGCVRHAVFAAFVIGNGMPLEVWGVRGLLVVPGLGAGDLSSRGSY